MSEEFRRFTRRDVGQNIEIIDMMTEQSLGTIVNISEYGVMIIAQVPVATDSIYQCEIMFPAEYQFRSPFIIGIQEMWAEPVTSGGVSCVGFRIIDIDSVDRLRVYEWVNEPLLTA
jgi:hypothetical protein